MTEHSIIGEEVSFFEDRQFAPLINKKNSKDFTKNSSNPEKVYET